MTSHERLLELVESNPQTRTSLLREFPAIEHSVVDQEITELMQSWLIREVHDAEVKNKISFKFEITQMGITVRSLLARNRR